MFYLFKSNVNLYYFPFLKIFFHKVCSGLGEVDPPQSTVVRPKEAVATPHLLLSTATARLLRVA